MSCRAARHYALFLQLFLATTAVAQEREPPIRVSTPLFDLVLMPDSTYGVLVLVSPGLGSTAGYKETTIEDMWLQPADINSWLPAARRLADSVGSLPTAGHPVGARLIADGGKSSFVLGYDQWKPISQRYFVRVENGVSGKSWQATLPDTSVYPFIAALTVASSRSRVAPLDSGPPRARFPCEVDEVPKITKRPPFHFPKGSGEGRVWAEYIIEASGTVDTASVQIILSDGAALETEVRRGLRTARYEPGRLNGQPVRVRVFQPFMFKWRS